MNVSFRRLNRANVHIIIFARFTQIFTKTKYHFTLILSVVFLALRVYLETYSQFFFYFIQISINIISFHFISFAVFYIKINSVFVLRSLQPMSSHYCTLYLQFVQVMWCVCVCAYIGECRNFLLSVNAQSKMNDNNNSSKFI